MNTDTPVWKCAVPTPLRRLFDYRPPKGWNGKATPGMRVTVPFGRRSLTAIVVQEARDSDIPLAQLRSASSVLDISPLYPRPLLALLQWAADYYQHPVGEVLPVGLSPGERRGKPERSVAEAGLTLTERGQGLPAGAPHNARKQAALIDRLRQGPVGLDQLKTEGFARSICQALLNKALATTCDLAIAQRWESLPPPFTANKEQQLAITNILAALGQFSVHLLYGVTGSGKTEVYLQSIAACLTRGQQALVLLPEISLTPQTLARFEARFKAPVLALHSGMGDAERDKTWAAARSGRAAVIVGTRSAVFTPLMKPGLIIVDEEHDPAFIQQDGLRYSARDIAIKRGQLEDCVVVLGSATPSLESWQNADTGRYQRHVLSQRAGLGRLPAKHLIDISGLSLSAGLSNEIIGHIDRVLTDGQQALIFLNRRGFANALVCHDCGWNAECQACDARMTLHKAPPGLHCHHCGRRHRLPATCAQCGSARLVGSGIGTQQTETFLSERFNAFPVVRVDSDTMASRAAMPALIERLKSGEPLLLIGTQMLSKGHHFPDVTLVAIVDADALLFSPDFRGEERLIQLVTQVAGRAGREEKAGEVFIQTRQPDHHLIAQLDAPYHQLLPALLAQRLQAGLPPHGALGVIRCDSQDKQEGLDFLTELRKHAPAPPGCRIIGPVLAAMARRKNRYRCHMIVAASHRGALAHGMRALVASAEGTRHSSKLNWSVDIDPYESL
jgi:primosomal protein N' (replication factor Y) (superfamily II helicase)